MVTQDRRFCGSYLRFCIRSDAGLGMRAGRLDQQRGPGGCVRLGIVGGRDRRPPREELTLARRASSTNGKRVLRPCAERGQEQRSGGAAQARPAPGPSEWRTALSNLATGADAGAILLGEPAGGHGEVGGARPQVRQASSSRGRAQASTRTSRSRRWRPERLRSWSCTWP